MEFPNIRTVAAYVGAIALLISTAFGVNAYFAKDKDLVELGKAFQIDQLDRQIGSVREQIWKIEDRINKVGNKQGLVDQKRGLEVEQKKLEEKKEDLKKKGS